MDVALRCLKLLKQRVGLSVSDFCICTAFNRLHCKQQVATNNKRWNTKVAKIVTDARDHLNRTKYTKRDHPVISTSVMAIEDLSPSVKQIKLLVQDEQKSAATFKAGQWVDVMIPEVDTVGGFSICNSPNSLQKQGYIELAVKSSDHPPAHWIHRKCKVGSLVDLRVGGEFFYNETNNNNVLLVAGGVGINPLLSILRHRRDIFQENKDNSMQRTALLYSAKTMQQLIYQEEITRICDSIPSRCQFHLTKENRSVSYFQNSRNSLFSREKITEESIQKFMQPYHSYEPSSTDCYICGPPSFIDKMKSHLLNLGCLEENIYYDKWW